jgi:hypothetical protein
VRICDSFISFNPHVLNTFLAILTFNVFNITDITTKISSKEHEKWSFGYESKCTDKKKVWLKISSILLENFSTKTFFIGFVVINLMGPVFKGC